MAVQKSKPKKRRWWLIVLIVIVGLLLLIAILPDPAPTGNVALIKVEGAIMGSGASSPFGESVASSQTLTRFLAQAESNPSVEVILLEINSPGGSAVASDEVAQAIEASGKPTVALIREVGASGAYWIASEADYVIANRMSITGSIGVVSSYLEFSGLMEEYGVSYERLVAGDKKDIGVPFRELTQAEKTLLESKLDQIHEYFIEAVAQNRGMSTAQTRAVATGEFFLGAQAVELGLVDSLGSKVQAEEYIQQTFGIKEIEYVLYEQDLGLFDVLAQLSSSFSYAVGEGIGSSLFGYSRSTISLQ